MINIFRKMKQKSKDRIFSEYPCADFLHNALHFLARNKPEVTYGEICYALLKSGNKLTDEEQKIFDNYRKTGQLEMMSDDNIDDWEEMKKKTQIYFTHGFVSLPYWRSYRLCGAG